jgi:hypothetical protein
MYCSKIRVESTGYKYIIKIHITLQYSDQSYFCHSLELRFVILTNVYSSATEVKTNTSTYI